MHTARVRRWLLFLVIFLCARIAFSQEAGCDQVQSIAKMARARSNAVLSAENKRAGDNYRARIVFAYRLFELNPRDSSAAGGLLKLIPRDDAQQSILMTLGDSLCNSENLSDMNTLARLRDAFPTGLSRAVLLVPSRMPAFVE